MSRALLGWIVGEGLGTALIEPGKLGQDGPVENFIDKCRDDWLNLDWSRVVSLPLGGRATIESWQRHYTGVRPPRSIEEAAFSS